MAGALAFSGYFCLRRPSFLQGTPLLAMVYSFFYGALLGEAIRLVAIYTR